MMARPARVRMRMRKPWVLARLRVFGWNVRFTTVAPNPVGVEGRQERGARAHRRFDGTGLPMVRQRGQSAGATVPHQALERVRATMLFSGPALADGPSSRPGFPVSAVATQRGSPSLPGLAGCGPPLHRERFSTPVDVW